MKFLAELDAVAPWKAFIDLIEYHYPKKNSIDERPSYPLDTMLRIHLMQQWYSLSDAAMKDALIEVLTKRPLAMIDMLSDQIPDETTILMLRDMLENNHLGEPIFAMLKAHLKADGMALKQGTIIDAILIAAPSSTKNKSGKRDQEMREIKKGSQWYLKTRVHFGADKDIGLIPRWRPRPLTFMTSPYQLSCCMARKSWCPPLSTTKALRSALKWRECPQPSGLPCHQAIGAPCTRRRLDGWDI